MPAKTYVQTNINGEHVDFLLAQTEFADERGFDEPRTDDVDADAARREFRRERAAERTHRRFRCRVDACVR